MVYEKELVGKSGSIEDKGAQRREPQHIRRDPVEKHKEKHAGERCGLHRKEHRKRKQEEKQRQSEGEKTDPFSLLQAVAEPQI